MKRLRLGVWAYFCLYGTKQGENNCRKSYAVH